MNQSLFEIPSYKRLALDVVAAEGCELVLRDGRRLLDLYGGHCVNLLGAGDERLGAVLAAQWKRLSFATNLLDLDVRAEFFAAFEPNLPLGRWGVFVSNSGAEANENALKIAFAATGRSKVVVFEGAFHGRTAAAAAASASQKPGFPRAPFGLERVAWGDLAAVERALDADAAACLLEPIQSLAGIADPPQGFLAGLRELCDRSGAALVFDEVQTGNGRLGEPWAAQYYGVVPDVFTTAKGAGGGFPIGLTVAQSAWVERFDASLLGSTFGGGPLALAAAAEVARRIAAPGFLENLRACSSVLAGLAGGAVVERVRGAGLLLGLELRAPHTAVEVRDRLLEQGFLTGTSWNPRVLRLAPPLVLSPDEALRFASALDRDAALSNVC